MRRPVQILIVVVAVLAGFGLAGCSQSPSNAAIVNGTTVTEEAVSSAANGFIDIVTTLNSESGQPPPSQANARGTVISWLIDGVLADQLSVVTGQTISDADVEQLANQYIDAPLFLKDPGSCQAMAGELRWTILRTKVSQGQLDQAVFTDFAERADINLNPRYGRWSSDSLSLQAPGLGLNAPILSGMI